ncbi:MAG: glycoside hydrolase family 3 C-terminal domain-containing protein [candidate division KSB1 bacterium]|nr:glycoside hydrolase family 3 C-terminal domain-containing protein [candidate division KSB1 bacterium]
MRRYLPHLLRVQMASVLLIGLACHRPQSYPFRNPSLPLDRRLDDLLSRLTLEEKISQMVNDAPPIKRLGIPEYDWWNECLHGVARAGVATVFPQAIGLAATWDRPLLHRLAEVISDEARAKHHEFLRHGSRERYQGLTFWSPNINIFRDPRWGRGMETYGEDPYLTGTLAVEFVRGLQGDDPRYLKVVATPKHFAVHSGPEPERHRFDAVVDERDLWDTYLPAFEMAVREGGAQSVMCAYNRLRGDPCCANRFLLTDVLRGRWGFSGYVVTDCGAIYDIWKFHQVCSTRVEASALALQAGTDLNCGDHFRYLGEAVRRGLVTEAQIDSAVRRLFRARFLLGMFDPPEGVPYAGIPFSVNNRAEHAELALEAARESIVLLKNDGLLPLRGVYRRVALIGPNGDHELSLLGNYTGVPSDPWTLWRALRTRLSGTAEVRFALGCDFAEGIPSLEPIPPEALRTAHGAPSEPGLTAEYFPNLERKGRPAVRRVDRQVDFNWFGNPPAEPLRQRAFSARWTGYLVPPDSGLYHLGGYGMFSFTIYLEDTALVVHKGYHSPALRSAPVHLEAGRPYRIKVEYTGLKPESQGRPSFSLLWARPARVREAEALALARQADLIILAMGLSPLLEGEQLPIDVPGFRGGDRTELDLPAPQERLLREIASLGKPTVLVLFSGSPLAIHWAAEKIPAILEAWYPGQEGGRAIVDVLFGAYNPGGRLPVTFYRAASDLPPFEDYSMDNRTYRYFRGPVLFPFGYGLSYTQFRYRDLRLPTEVTAGQKVQVSVRVANAGTMAGDEVVQLYVRAEGASHPAPIRSLRGYRRVHLQPGEERTLTFELGPRDFSLVTREGRRVVEPGVYEIAVGGKQPGFKGLADASTTQVLSARLRVVGKPVEVNWD